MCDQDHFEDDLHEYEKRGLITRRQFGVLVGAGACMVLPQVANAVAVTESDLTITTPDGTAEAYFVRPATGAAPGVLVWPDIFGLRPAFRQMGKRLAESGYAVVVVNQFYRAKKLPIAANGANTPIPDLIPLAQALNETTHMTDAKAFVAWLDSQPSVAKDKKIGTQGYCMGGPMAFRTAAAMPDRVGAVASFHGGGLVTENPNSPHLQASKTKAQFLIAVASRSRKTRRSGHRATAWAARWRSALPQRCPTASALETFEKAKLPAEIEVYSGAHGWCPPDSRVYNEPDAEKAWTRLLALYGKALA
jgi:carboxymethylenebutenolidase